MKRPNEFKTGLLVLGGFAIFIFANIVIRGINFSQEGYTVFIRFPAISGIGPGSDVRLADGIRIGKVIELKVEKDSTVVETRISRETELTTESKGSITSTTFLSELFVSISAGTGLGEKLTGGETIEGEAPMSMVDGIREFGLLMKNLNNLVSVTGEDSIIRDITDIIHNAVASVEQVVNASGSDINASFTSLRGLAAKLDQLAAEFRGTGDKTQALMNTINAHLPAILANLNTASANLAKITDMAANGQSAIALLLSDAKLHTDITIIVENLKILSARLRNDPSILLWRDGGR